MIDGVLGIFGPSPRALMRVVRRSYGIEPQEAAGVAARALGFDRAVEDGSFERDAGLLRAAKPVPATREEGQAPPSQG